jgi:hypothetical protein
MTTFSADGTAWIGIDAGLGDDKLRGGRGDDDLLGPRR